MCFSPDSTLQLNHPSNFSLELNMLSSPLNIDIVRVAQEFPCYEFRLFVYQSKGLPNVSVHCFMIPRRSEGMHMSVFFSNTQFNILKTLEVGTLHSRIKTWLGLHIQTSNATNRQYRCGIYFYSRGDQAVKWKRRWTEANDTLGSLRFELWETLKYCSKI